MECLRMSQYLGLLGIIGIVMANLDNTVSTKTPAYLATSIIPTVVDQMYLNNYSPHQLIDIYVLVRR